MGNVCEVCNRDGNVIKEKDAKLNSEISQNASDGVPSKAAAPKGTKRPNHKVFDAVLDKEAPAGPKLGIDVDAFEENESLPIMAVTGGLVKAWNQAHPDKMIADGDHIIEVNGVTKNGQSMMDCCRSDMVLNVKVKGLRCDSGHSLLPDERVVASCTLCSADEKVYRCSAGCDYGLCSDCWNRFNNTEIGGQQS